jgi:4-aminobutyrate aminotransferase-like enzyme
MEGCAVSVIVIARFAVSDLGKATEWAKDHAEIPEDITVYGKSLGQIGHRMLTDGKDLVVIDEWPDADTFNTFFAGAARMGEFLSGAGVVGEPDVTILDELDVPGTF